MKCGWRIGRALGGWLRSRCTLIVGNSDLRAPNREPCQPAWKQCNM